MNIILRYFESEIAISDIDGSDKFEKLCDTVQEKFSLPKDSFRFKVAGKTVTNDSMICESELTAEENVIEIDVIRKGYQLYKELLNRRVFLPSFDDPELKNSLEKVVKNNDDVDIVELSLQFLQMNDEKDVLKNILFNFKEKNFPLELLIKYIDVNMRDDNGETVLFGLVRDSYRDNYLSLFEKFIRNGIDIEIKNIYGCTVLMYTAIWDRLKCMDLLLEAGADISTQNNHGDTLLIFATDRTNLDIADRLIDIGVDVNATNTNGDTPLLFAAMRSNLVTVNRLIDAGADINVANIEGETPLMFAAMRGNLDVINRLIDAGADVNARDNNGETSLIAAAFLERFDILDRLIDAGADINIKDNDGCTALYALCLMNKDAIHYNCCSKTVKSIKKLIEIGADVNAKRRDISLLSAAVTSKNDELVDILLRAGADIGDSLFVALKNNHVFLAKKIMKYIENPDKEKIMQSTNDYSIIRELVIREIFEDIKSENTYEYLKLAIDNDDHFIVKSLLARDKSIDRKVVLQLAQKRENKMIISLCEKS